MQVTSRVTPPPLLPPSPKEEGQHPCPHLAKSVPLVHEVDPAEVFDPREHGEEP